MDAGNNDDIGDKVGDDKSNLDAGNVVCLQHLDDGGLASQAEAFKGKIDERHDEPCDWEESGLCILIQQESTKKYQHLAGGCTKYVHNLCRTHWAFANDIPEEESIEAVCCKHCSGYVRMMWQNHGMRPPTMKPRAREDYAGAATLTDMNVTIPPREDDTLPTMDAAIPATDAAKLTANMVWCKPGWDKK